MQIFTNELRRRFGAYGLLSLFALLIIACGDDDPAPEQIDTGDETFFISASGDLSGQSADYILTTDSLQTGQLSIAGNGLELTSSGYRWIFKDDNSVAVGLIYNQGDPGTGLAYKLDTSGLKKVGEFQITSRFTSYGFFESYAITSVGGQTLEDSELDDGAVFNFFDTENSMSLNTKAIHTKGILGNDQQVTFSGIVDMGNGQFLSGAVASAPKDPEAGGGNSTGEVSYPDSCWVVAFDENLDIQNIYRSGELSYSSGRFRSQYYSQISKDDDGNVYVFSGTFEASSTKPAGAIRINEGASDFDDNYYFNIEQESDGYHFRNVWHIADDYFMLEFYNEKEFTTNTAATQYGIVKMSTKTFNWVSGVPAKESIADYGLPTSYNGKLYFPLTTNDGQYPAIYVIDPATATATKGITVVCNTLEAVGLLKTDN